MWFLSRRGVQTGALSTVLRIRIPAIGINGPRFWFSIDFEQIQTVMLLREAAKKSFFCGIATKRGLRALPLREKNFFKAQFFAASLILTKWQNVYIYILCIIYCIFILLMVML